MSKDRPARRSRRSPSRTARSTAGDAAARSSSRRRSSERSSDSGGSKPRRSSGTQSSRERRPAPRRRPAGARQTHTDTGARSDGCLDHLIIALLVVIVALAIAAYFIFHQLVGG